MAILAAITASPALGQELKQASATLSAKISESGKKRVAVVDFTDLQGNVSELGRYLAEELSGALVNDAHGFRVIERAHLKAILQEHKLAATGLIDPETARQLGKIAGVDTLVTGTITSAFGDTVRVMVKALDVSTAEIIGQSTADIPKTEWIQRLLGQGIAPAPASNEDAAGRPPTSSSASGAGRAVVVQENSLLLSLKTCQRSEATLSCAGSLTNKAHRRRWVQLGGDSSVVDDLGNRYPVLDRRLLFVTCSELSWLPSPIIPGHLPSNVMPVIFKKPQRPVEPGTRQELEPDLPINFCLSLDGLAQAATRVSIVLSYSAEESVAPAPGALVGGWPAVRKVVFKDIPVRQ